MRVFQAKHCGLGQVPARSLLTAPIQQGGDAVGYGKGDYLVPIGIEQRKLRPLQIRRRQQVEKNCRLRPGHANAKPRSSPGLSRLSVGAACRQLIGSAQVPTVTLISSGSIERLGEDPLIASLTSRGWLASTPGHDRRGRPSFSIEAVAAGDATQYVIAATALENFHALNRS